MEITTIKAKITTSELVDILKSLTEKTLGFIDQTIPPRDWLINAVHALNQDHIIIKGIIDDIKRPFPKE